MIQKVVLLLGTNIGDRKNNLTTAAKLVDEQVGKVVQTSAIYQTAAWGVEDQEDFLNQVIVLNTTLGPVDLLHQILSVEKQMGRERTEKWGPRLIDIDILFMGDLVINSEELKVPHPQLHNRRFTLAPLNELMPELVHPVLHKTISQLWAECPDTLPVTLYADE